MTKVYILVFASLLNYKDGLGPLKVIPGGIQLRGEAMVLDKLVASRIGSRKGQPIHIESSRNISLLSRGGDGRVHNKLFLGKRTFSNFLNDNYSDEYL